jgi:hypothetical protein
MAQQNGVGGFPNIPLWPGVVAGVLLMGPATRAFWGGIDHAGGSVQGYWRSLMRSMAWATTSLRALCWVVGCGAAIVVGAVCLAGGRGWPAIVVVVAGALFLPAPGRVWSWRAELAAQSRGRVVVPSEPGRRRASWRLADEAQVVGGAAPAVPVGPVDGPYRFAMLPPAESA